MSQFYLTLPSNSYLANQSGSEGQQINEPVAQLLSKFRVQLPHKIRLEGDWEVALSEIMYPNSWFNITKEMAMYGSYIKTLQKLKSLVKYSLINTALRSSWFRRSISTLILRWLSMNGRRVYHLKISQTTKYPSLTRKI